MSEKKKGSTLGGCLKFFVFIAFCGAMLALVVGLMNSNEGRDVARPARPELKPTVPYDAIDACQKLIRKSANHPSTVRFPMGTTSTDMKAEGGGYRVKLGFTAKNSFGLETRFDALCVFKPRSLDIADFGAWERDK